MTLLIGVLFILGVGFFVAAGFNVGTPRRLECFGFACFGAVAAIMLWPG